MHSATKYIGGHGDAMGGVVVTDPESAAALRPLRTVTGGVLDPWSAYLLHRGLATLPVRVHAQQESAGVIARALADDDRVARVFYPGLPGADPDGLLGRQMAGGGAMVSFELDGGIAVCERVVAGLSLITHAVSLGGVDTLIQHPAALTHRPVADEARPHDGVLRLSVGLEDPRDILADLQSGLAGA
jgi:cystathionine beta-lyase/cystathionine gamma-synthase